MDLHLQAKRAVVAASSSGLGFAVAKALADEGARVAICGRDADRLAAAAADLPDGTVALEADVSTPDGARAFVEQAIAALGGIDILVPNGGGPPAGTYADTPFDRYGPALEANLLATVAMCQAAVDPMVEQRWGRIIAVTSATVRQPAAQLILSNTARAGATAFLKTLATEIAPHGVTVNTVQPGSHDTDRLRSLHGGDISAVAKRTPTGEVGRPADFGATVAFLCSDQARFITGSSLPLDGGAVAGLQ